MVVSLDQYVNGVENSRAEELKKSNLNKTMALVFLSLSFHSFTVFGFLNELKRVGKLKEIILANGHFQLNIPEAII